MPNICANHSLTSRNPRQAVLEKNVNSEIRLAIDLLICPRTSFLLENRGTRSSFERI